MTVNIKNIIITVVYEIKNLPTFWVNAGNRKISQVREFNTYSNKKNTKMLNIRRQLI